MFSQGLSRFASALPATWKYALGRYKPIYTRLLTIGEATAEVKTTAGLLRWRIDELTSQQFLLATYEPYMQRAFSALIRPGFVVYDVGAHAGFHSLFCGLLVGASGRVVAFEPNPQNFASIESQLALNPSLRISLSSFALSDTSALRSFNVAHGSSQGTISDFGSIQVETRTIDGLIKGGIYPPPDLLKIDVEGHEEQVLRGATEVLIKHKPIVLCDYNDSSTLDIIVKICEPIGYSISAGPPVIGLPEALREIKSVTGL